MRFLCSCPLWFEVLFLLLNHVCNFFEYAPLVHWTKLLDPPLIIVHRNKPRVFLFFLGHYSFTVILWFNYSLHAVFNYDASIHNVAVVDGNNYQSCRASPTSKSFSSGKDQIKLSKGRNYFICSIPGHCEAGLKLAVDASWATIITVALINLQILKKKLASMSSWTA